MKLRRRLSLQLMSRAGIEQILMLPGSQSFKCDALRFCGACIGEKVRLNHGLILVNAERGCGNLKIGDNVYLGHGATLDLKEKISIGSDVTISMNCNLVTHLDVGEIPLAQNYPRRAAAIIIENNVYLGAGATILHGVTIGSGSVVAAGAVVTRDVPPNTLVGGVPARVLKNIEESS